MDWKIFKRGTLWEHHCKCGRILKEDSKVKLEHAKNNHRCHVKGLHLMDVLKRSQLVTHKMQDIHGSWNTQDQFNKMAEEMHEIADEIDKEKWDSNKISNEICDLIITGFTMADIVNITPKEMHDAMDRTLRKIEGRVNLR